ncbi:sugar ABC transporter permease [Paenibacillus sp. MMS20-IR301]|uniref:carbohydrate ABC transporter permease n=1 Tax=Paenibacillus sp. MMS20-IR301 TaxID=2895946 RepID=UPI0028EC0BDA|nr:sugar ABC transporter permease [Paenibacillus sp. MMS20-IR301]WNS41549.1 sugar ABC transporter permease [Paenibacillus sp. MMS20-IR301]
MEKALSNKKIIALFLLPGLIVFLVFYFVPIVMTAYYSLQDWDGINPMAFIGLDNYTKMFTADKSFWQAVWNSLAFLLVGVLIQLPVSFGLALLVSRRMKGRKWFRNIYFFPVVMSTTMVSLLWVKIYDPNIGMLNTLMETLGLGAWTGAWLGDTKTALLSVLIVTTWHYVGYNMLILFAGMQGIPEQYYEAAKLDGATGWKAVRHITFPLLSDVLRICIVLNVIYALKTFESVYVMTNGGPLNSTTVIALKMFQEAFLKQNFGYGSALAVFMVLECLVISWVLNKVLTQEKIEY